MESINVRQIGINDVQQLQQIGKQTFSETFSSTNTEENMTAYLKDGFSEEKLSTELNSPGSSFYFAELQGNPIGYLKVNFGEAQTEPVNIKALEIERIYVLKDFHGKNVGQLLYEKALEVAKQKNATSIWLGVWEENKRAIGFYQKNGFIPFDKHVFKLGTDEQTDIMMKLEFNMV